MPTSTRDALRAMVEALTNVAHGGCRLPPSGIDCRQGGELPCWCDHQTARAALAAWESREPLREDRAWWWRRQWTKHALSCRLCMFAAEGEMGAEKCCELGGLTVRLAAIYARDARTPAKARTP